MCVYLRAKFQISSVILTGGVDNFTSPISKRTPKKPTQTRVNEVILVGATMVRAVGKCWILAFLQALRTKFNDF